MACNKFEQTGLLYLYGELGRDEALSYESHLAECGECMREVEECRNDRASFYAADVLGDDPSPSVDAEILRVCANPAKAVTAALTPMLFIRKYAAVPIFMMLIMVAIGGYVKYQSMSAEDLRAELVDGASPEKEMAAKLARESSGTAGDSMGLARADSLRDEVQRQKGNLDMEGVVTVSGE